MRIAICGAGIAGLALAHCLRGSGAEVTVLERAPAPRRQGYMIDFFGPGHEAAELTGLLPRLRELRAHISEAALHDAGGRRRSHIDYERFTRAVDGRLLSITRPNLERALRESAETHAELRYASTVTGIEDAGQSVRVTTAEGPPLEADLLVGADGVQSTVRRLVFGPRERFLRYLGMHTAAYTFDDPTLHALTAGRFAMTDSANRMMGVYGAEGTSVAVFAVHRTTETRLPADPRAALRAAYGDLGWIAPRALEACPEPSQVYYDLVAQIEAPDWSRGRVVLLGDACGAVSLVAGQGASLAVAGAQLLARQLTDHGPGPKALRRYEQVWRPVVADKQRAARSSMTRFLPATPGQVRARRLLLRASSALRLEPWLARSITGRPELPPEASPAVGGRLAPDGCE